MREALGVDGSKEPPGLRRGAGAHLWRRDAELRPLRRYTPRIASLVKKLMRKRAPRRVCSSRPVQTRLDEELVVRLSGKGKKLVRQRAPRHQRRNLEEFQRRGAALFYALIDVVASSLDRGVAYRG